MENRLEKAALEAVIAWYAADERRTLPWRKTRDPYAVWASEVMLQQTQAPRVIDYFSRFLQRFPTVETLASAEWSDLLPVWRGLGFYGRGKRMLETARAIVQNHGAVFPSNETVLRSLPGVGPYTAAAISSFAFGAAVPAIDTNLSRVLSRVFASDPKKLDEPFRAIWATLSDPTAANHALMDLGAMVCRSRKTACEACPLRSVCHFFASGKHLRLGDAPKTASLRPKGKIEVVILLLHHDGKYLLGKRPETRGGEWEFAGGKVENGETYRSAGKREAIEELGIEVAVRPPMLSVETDEFWLRFCRAQILRGEPQPRVHERLAWVSPSEFDAFPMPTANREIAEKLKKIRK